MEGQIPYHDTDAGQMIAGAKKYLSAADLLMRSDDFAERPTLLLAPILHLACHGAEQLLKFPLVSMGLSPDLVRKKFGHDLWRLWNEAGNAVVKSLVQEAAQSAWDRARTDPKWSDKFQEQPKHTFEQALRTMSRLHTAESDFALRYIAQPQTLAPRPWLPVQALLPVADQGVRMPASLITVPSTEAKS